MRLQTLRRIFPLVFSLLLALLSAGCFDYEVELDLTQPRQGAVTVQLTLPEQEAIKHPVGTLDTLIWPIPQRERKIVDSRMVIKERSSFTFLDDLAARRVIFEVKEIGTGLLGWGNYTYRAEVRLEMAEGDLPDRDVLPGSELEKRTPQALTQDPARQRARELRSRSLAGHFLTLAIKIPGKVNLARSLVLGASEVQAVIEHESSRVAWKVPLAVLLNENPRNTMVFSTDFKGHLEFKAYEHNWGKSHYPDAFEEALGRGKKVPGGRVQFHRQRQEAVPK
ncbi:conserved hypothetical protein [Desulfarculales bacterium]